MTVQLMRLSQQLVLQRFQEILQFKTEVKCDKVQPIKSLHYELDIYVVVTKSI